MQRAIAAHRPSCPKQKSRPIGQLFDMVLRAGLEPARITPHAPQTCAATNYATSAFFQKNYLFAGGFGCIGTATLLFAGAALAAGTAEFVGAAVLFVSPIVMVCSLPGPIVASATGVPAGVGAGVASVAGSSLPDSTETFPLNAGIEINRAEIINTIAAPIVNFPRTDAVPRGANALLETLLVNRAPASVLPGCKSTDATSRRHDIKKIA